MHCAAALHIPALVAETLLASAQSFEVRGSFRDVSVQLHDDASGRFFVDCDFEKDDFG